MSKLGRQSIAASFGACIALSVVASGCGKDGPMLIDGGTSDGGRQDALVVDTTPPETTIDTAPAALTSAAAAQFTFHADEPSTFACTLDGGAAAPCDGSFAATVGEGAHTFAVVATDTAGNVDPTPATATWTVDLTPPDTTITTHPPALDNSVDVEFDFTSEAGATFECRVDGAAFAACASPDLVKGLAAGAHTFEVRAVDAAGNVDATPATWSWTIDTTTPDTTIDSGPVGFVQATTATFTFSSPNAGAGATFACALDAAPLTPCTSPITYTSLAEADHTFTVRVTSSAGTADPTPAVRVWTVDHTAPTVTITGGPSDPTPTSVAAPSFPFTTAGAPIVTECETDTGGFAPCTSPYTTATLTDGPHAITVRVTDAAGNSSSATRAFTIDTVAPTVALDTHPADPTKATTAAFTFHSADGGTSFECAIDAGGFAGCASGVSFPGLAGGAGTAHTFRVRATDPAGNTGADTTFTWTIDTVGPTVVIDTRPADPTNVTTAAFTFHSADGGTSFECAIDGGGFASCASGVSFPGLAGGAGTTHTFDVRATDAATNTGAATHDAWLIDTLAPTTTIAVATEPASPTPTTAGTFGFTSNEAGATFTCTLDGAATACNAGTLPYAVGAGGHTFSVFATDPAGNPDATPATFTWTVDVTPPTITRTPPGTWSVDYFPFTFTGPLPGLAYQCAEDGGAFTACASPFTQTGASFTAASTFTVRWVDGKGNPSAAAPVSWQPTAGLVLYYPLDRDGNNRSPIEPYDPHDGAGGAFGFVGGLAGGALDASKAITLPGTAAPLSERTGYTITFWVFVDGVTSMQGRLLDTRGAGGGCTFTGDSKGTLTLECAGTPTGVIGTVTARVPTRRWVSVLVRYQDVGENVELFVDGALAATLANPTAADVFSSKQLAGALLADDAVTGTEWLIDDLRIYDTAAPDDASQCATYLDGAWNGVSCQPLTPQLDYAMDGYPPFDSSGNSGTIADVATTIVDGIYGKAISIPSSTALAASSFNPGVNSAHTFTAWFYDDGSGNSGYLFNGLCPGGQGCLTGAHGGISAHIDNGSFEMCGDEGGLPGGPRCKSAPYAVKAWHQVTLVETAHDSGDGWATDQLDGLIDGKPAMSIDFTDQGNSSLWFGAAGSLTFAPMTSASKAPGVFLDEFKMWRARRDDWSPDVQCTFFDGWTWDYATDACTAPPPPF